MADRAYDTNAIERMFCRLKDYRRIAARYDKLATNFASSVCLAAAVSVISRTPDRQRRAILEGLGPDPSGLRSEPMPYAASIPFLLRRTAPEAGSTTASSARVSTSSSASRKSCSLRSFETFSPNTSFT